ncbi:MAG TPA: nucleotidyltransferase [Gemmataceae bacterium]|jgi:nucleotidyltransferase/DNA polymerase involved in DNA repair
MPSPAAIGHLDCDCFYVSAERVRDYFLRDKPVGILGNQGACVIAKSYEMKHTGVKTGMAIWDALRLCPMGVYVKRDFRWYEVLSRRVLEIVRTFSPRVEYHSIDDFFFEVYSSDKGRLQELAEQVRDTILREVGVPVTVGIARTKILAKLISDSAKPFGALAVFDPDAVRALLESQPVTEISGIASRRAARLEPYGITTCLDLAQADRCFIRQLLTITGEALWYELNGDPVLPLYTERPPHKMLARGGSLGGSTEEPERLYAWMVRNLERLVEELEFHVVHAGALSVAIQHKDGIGGFCRGELPAPTNRFDLLLETARFCLGRAWSPEQPVTHMHIIASQLRKPGYVQLGLFDRPQEQERAVAEVKKEINTEVGRFALRSGATLPLADIYRDEAQSYDICDVRGKICF